MAKQATQIQSEMLTYLRGVYPSLDFSEGEILHDLIVYAPSFSLASLHEFAEDMQKAQSVVTADITSLVRLAYDRGVIRKSSKPSFVFCTFYTNTPPASDINIPLNTSVSTLPFSDASPVQFLTLTSVTMYKSLQSSYFNPDTNRYEIVVLCKSVQAGKFTVVGKGNIIQLTTPVLGIDGCTNNSASYGGEDAESIESLRARIQSKSVGLSLGTKGGLISEIVADESVKDVKVVSNGESKRLEFGAIDVYVKGIEFSSYREIFTTYEAYLPAFIFTKQPVKQEFLQPVLSSESGILSTSLYTVERDTSFYSNSVFGKDKLKWTSPMLSATYGAIYVTYQYNSLIERLQSKFEEQEDKKLYNTSLLIKEATALPIDISFTVRLYPGFNSTNVIEEITSAVSRLFEDYNIGEQVQQADVAFTVLRVDGVDDLFLPFAVFESSDGVVTPDVNNNLNIPEFSYASLGNLSITAELR